MSTETTTETTTPATSALPAASGRWSELLTVFAATLKRDLLLVETRLVEETEGRDDAALAILFATPEDTFIKWLLPEPVKAKEAMIRAAVQGLKGGLKPATPSPVVGAPSNSGVQNVGGAHPSPFSTGASVLPSLPMEMSAFNSLIVGGVLQEGIQSSDPVIAIEAAVSLDVGIPDVPDAIVERINTYTNGQRKRVNNPGAVLKLIKEMRRKKYSEALSALDLDASIVTETERKEFMSRMRDGFWPALRRHFDILRGWIETNKNNGMDMTTMMSALGAMMSGNGAMMQAMVQPPDIMVLRNATADLANEVNALYAGLYTYGVARALAAESVRIIGYLDPTAPDGTFAQILTNTGLADREALLNAIGASVTESFVRSKRAAQEYAFAALEMRNRGDAEIPVYAVQLFNRGVMVPWADLGRASIATASVRPLPPPTQDSRVRLGDTPRHRPFEEVVVKDNNGYRSR